MQIGYTLQDKDGTRESHHQKVAAEHAERIHASCVLNSDPSDERRHPGVLNQQCEQHQNGPQALASPAKAVLHVPDVELQNLQGCRIIVCFHGRPIW
jgi:hypothetical protein